MSSWICSLFSCLAVPGCRPRRAGRGGVDGSESLFEQSLQLADLVLRVVVASPRVHQTRLIQTTRHLSAIANRRRAPHEDFENHPMGCTAIQCTSHTADRACEINRAQGRLLTPRVGRFARAGTCPRQQTQRIHRSDRIVCCGHDLGAYRVAMTRSLSSIAQAATAEVFLCTRPQEFVQSDDGRAWEHRKSRVQRDLSLSRESVHQPFSHLPGDVVVAGLDAAVL
jgi:hypothetical protein